MKRLMTRQQLKDVIRQYSDLGTTDLHRVLTGSGVKWNYRGEHREPSMGLLWRLREEIKREDTTLASPSLRVGVWDLETTNLRSDMGNLMVACFMDVNTRETSVNNILAAGDEDLLIDWAVDMYESFDILVGFNSLAFDKNFLNGVATRAIGRYPAKRVHIDLYQVARHGWKGLPQSYSLQNLLEFFGLREKDKPHKEDWRKLAVMDDDAVARITERCVEDVLATAELFQTLKPHWLEWKGQR